MAKNFILDECAKKNIKFPAEIAVSNKVRADK